MPVKNDACTGAFLQGSGSQELKTPRRSATNGAALMASSLAWRFKYTLIEQKIRSPNCPADISNAQQPDAATATGPRTGRGTLPSTQGALLGNAVLKTRHPSLSQENVK